MKAGPNVIFTTPENERLSNFEAILQKYTSWLQRANETANNSSDSLINIHFCTDAIYLTRRFLKLHDRKINNQKKFFEILFVAILQVLELQRTNLKNQPILR